jgi:RND family efflux transporter MFP subunit
MNPKLWLPIAILGGALLLSALLYSMVSSPEREEPERLAPLVRTQVVKTEPFRFVVRGHGTVTPRTESELVAQVAGEAVWVAPSMVPGGFFAEDEVLVRIEPGDYETDLESARAGLARSRSELSRARKERDRQRQLADVSVTSESRIDDAENAFRIADANLREARAQLSRAERDLARTEIRAPYDGRVREKSIDVGQFASRGTAIARIYAVDYAEVRLPVADRELSFLDLPLGYTSEEANGEGPEVRVHAEFAGRRQTFEAHIVRTEGEIDPRSRTVNVVARVEDPYGRDRDRDRPTPLAVGLFVEAEILGRELPDAVLLPRAALHEEDRVLVVDSDDRLRFRDVEVLRIEREIVVIGDGLRVGERVCISPLPAAVDGMSVRVAESQPSVAKREP